MLLFDTPLPLASQAIYHPAFEEKNLDVQLLRIDEIHPSISGNKWFKLKYNLDDVVKKKLDGIVTFGGQFSNHIHAMASATDLLGLKSVGIIAGANQSRLTSTLLYAQQKGMELHFVSRAIYRKKHEPAQMAKWQALFPNFGIVPEGGTNHLAIKGAAEIVDFAPANFDYIITACGTGGTLAGLATRLKSHQKAIGVSVLKGEDKLTAFIESFIGKGKNFEVISGYHFGGYAKTTEELKNFIRQFYEEKNILLEQVYTAKMMMSVIDLAQKNYFKKSSKLVLLHTGGLQGLDKMSFPFMIK